jgi:hypothetical protein
MGLIGGDSGGTPEVRDWLPLPSSSWPADVLMPHLPLYSTLV